MTQDQALELYVELEDLTRRLRDVQHRLGQFIGQRPSGLPRPNDYPIPSSDGHPPLPAHICAEACDGIED